jgi:hypothetical protein
MTLKIKGDRVSGEWNGCSFSMTEQEIVEYIRKADYCEMNHTEEYFVPD